VRTLGDWTTGATGRLGRRDDWGDGTTGRLDDWSTGRLVEGGRSLNVQHPSLPRAGGTRQARRLGMRRICTQIRELP
jgi:hypothetical protein